MGLETGTTISSFITSNPTETDPVNQGDNHIRLIKSVLQAQFPGSIGTGFNTAITATEAELNSLHNSGIGNLVANVHADGSGNVGIGTASPAQKLHVAGNSYVSGTTLLADAGFMFNSDALQDTGMSWASDGVMNVRCNGVTVGQFNSTGFTGNSATANSATNATNATNATTSTTCTGNSATATYAPLISSTAQSLSGATVSFTGIPSWAKRITIMCTGLSTNGTAPPLIQLGYGATTYATSGYSGATDMFQSTPSASLISAGINLTGGTAVAADSYQGCLTLTLMTGNTWVGTFVGSQTNAARLCFTSASIGLPATLTAIRFYINGTQVFDAGSANIMYE
jgi:hypothetical protein